MNVILSTRSSRRGLFYLFQASRNMPIWNTNLGHGLLKCEVTCLKRIWFHPFQACFESTTESPDYVYYVRFRLFSLIVLCGQLLYTLICFTSPKLCAEMLKSLKTVISLYFNSAFNSALLAPPFRLAGHIADAQGSLDLSLDTYSLTFLVGCYMCCGVTQRLKPWRKTGTLRTWTGTREHVKDVKNMWKAGKDSLQTDRWGRWTMLDYGLLIQNTSPNITNSD